MIEIQSKVKFTNNIDNFNLLMIVLSGHISVKF